MVDIQKTAMRNMAKAIALIDALPSYVSVYGSTENVERNEIARKNLVNILFSNGYELKQGGGITKSKTPRKLLE